MKTKHNAMTAALLISRNIERNEENMKKSESALIKKFLQLNIKKKGILIAIVTDLNAQIQMKKIIKLEISHLIDCLVTSEEAGLDKPNFSCFSILNEKINKNNIPLKYWMVGDDIRKDLIGAKIELEARTFWIDIFEKGNKKNRYIDHQINSLLEINEFI